ncbi:MAG: glycoside hydrolase family 97 N-terminal domain-containing protein, partial [Chitinophagaceae bacterium]|nr:glycoside hydrolase family 97 N-terminal domain-containing protein [Chitinophagaceae bacterium]
MNRISILLISFIAIAAFSCSAVLSSKNEWSVSSPDGRLCMILKLDSKTGKIGYSAMMRNGKDTVTLIGSSPLGIILKNQSFMADLDFSHAAEIRTINDEYTLASGKQLVNKATAKEISVSFKNIYKETITIIMRAYNDGLAFRYYLPKKENTTHIITADLTGFNIPEGSKAWLQPYDKIKRYSPAYEKYYTEVLSGIKAPDTEGWCFPALFEINNHWILITEADHDGTSPAFHLSPDAEEGTYNLRQPESKEAENTGNNLTTTTLPWKSPWRVIIASDSLDGIIQSQLVNNVARPPINIDFSWVKPGRSSWSWWSDRSSSRNADKLKSFIDLSS